MRDPYNNMNDCKNLKNITPAEINERIANLNTLTEIQSQDGNWDYDPYMHGMANGLILALSTMQDSDDVKYLEAPEEWISDIPDPNHTGSGIDADTLPARDYISYWLQPVNDKAMLVENPLNYPNSHYDIAVCLDSCKSIGDLVYIWIYSDNKWADDSILFNSISGGM